jgi:hypothetical protein
MERRNAMTAAATAALTLIAGAGGMALSSGILGAAADDGVGRVSPVPSRTGEHAISESHVPLTTTLPPPATVPTTPQVTITERPADATSATSAVRTEDRRDGKAPETEAEGHEYEGADDDD